MTLALEGGEWSAACPSHTLPPEKTQYPLYRRLGGPQGRSGQAEDLAPPWRFDPWTVQPIVSRYTDWATRPTIMQQVEVISYRCIGTTDWSHLQGFRIQKVQLSTSWKKPEIMQTNSKFCQQIGKPSTEMLQMWSNTLTRIIKNKDLIIIYD